MLAAGCSSGGSGGGSPRLKLGKTDIVVNAFPAIDSAGLYIAQDQGATQDFPIQGYAVTAKWAKQNPNTLKAFTIALSQGQQVADTDRAAVEKVLAKYLGIDKQAAAFISLPTFPLGVDAVRLQRVVSAMKRFNLLPKGTNFQVTSMITG
jgi:NitT/TauT family transport system substrate-binding protein